MTADSYLWKAFWSLSQVFVSQHRYCTHFIPQTVYCIDFYTFLGKKKLPKNYSILKFPFFWNYWARNFGNIEFYFLNCNWSLLVFSYWEFLFAYSYHYNFYPTWTLNENHHFSPPTCLNSITERPAELVLGIEPCELFIHRTVHSNFRNSLNLSWTFYSWKLPHSTTVVDTVLKIFQTAIAV